MSNSKEKRIKKLNKNRIWPSVFGLFGITVIFALIFIIVIANSLGDMVNRKILTGVSQAERIAELFEDYEGEHKQGIQDSIVAYIEIATDLEAVWVSDLSGNKIWANGKQVPNTKNVQKGELTNGESIRLIIEEDSKQILSPDGIKNLFTKENFKKIVNSGFYGDESLTKIKVWQIQEINDLKVYVLQDINLYVYDCYIVLSSIALFAILIVLFTIH